jgi:hypothetical protein
MVEPSGLLQFNASSPGGGGEEVPSLHLACVVHMLYGCFKVLLSDHHLHMRQSNGAV